MENDQQHFMYCPHCGAKIETGLKFCPNCGTALETIATTSESSTQETTQPVHSEPVKPAPAVPESNAYQQFSVGADTNANVSTPANTKPAGQHTILLVIGWISAIVSLLVVPILFGVVGLIFGYLARSRGRKEAGTILMIASVAAALLGTIIGAIVGAGGTGGI
ncbi:zinc ribbon domain-containing protein [Schleiferilactobacillus perolens]|uniref:Zinc-ribbon domain-containing protein n=1 Tax=Schleiferilactobacillus perolens DSM 12744 TaxID=1423792 RepID=A0A0R1N8A2_9LACO|nr:zinc ribbon domain-containing protein [Schleiferilactobacillus perolens]KRL13722.1 hypothetical protein FD09_GL001749 [Schleiferilactobacillus perolens DSM 12744]